MKRRLWICLAMTITMGTSGAARLSLTPPQTEYGPAKGTLVIVGGGSTDNTGIIEKFIELSGGADAHFIVIPTAGGNRAADGKLRVYSEQATIGPWKRRGLKNVRMLHTHDPRIADTEEFAKPLKEANGVWFNGGRQWNIVDS